MPRQSITLSATNDMWLKEKAAGDDFHNKSEVINSLIRDARQEDSRLEWVRAALLEGEQGDTSPIDPEAIRHQVKQSLRANGKL